MNEQVARRSLQRLAAEQFQEWHGRLVLGRPERPEKTGVSAIFQPDVEADDE